MNRTVFFELYRLVSEYFIDYFSGYMVIVDQKVSAFKVELPPHYSLHQVTAEPA